MTVLGSALRRATEQAAAPTPPDPTSRVTMTAPCPCGRVVTWEGVVRQQGGGTDWRIQCHCTQEAA